MIGRTLGHYRIVEKIGAGGMGEVYRACDERLERDVALKILPASALADPTARARLLAEARAASSLNHPNVCTIYEVGEADGQAYIAMEYVAGQPLSAQLRAGGLAAETLLRYGAQIADALAHAHERGIIHRDLKSANVVITPEGRAKVLDFGLARRLEPETLDEATRSRASLTVAGGLAGTLPYLAPEVLRGEAADARSDIWALGVVLHELAGGKLPFGGKTGFELSSAILREVPTALPAAVPAGLQAVIQRCLAKEPGQRYQRASELRAALETLQSAATAGAQEKRPRTRREPRAKRKPIRALAVLPLENLSGDPEQEYFADGMTEALITGLAQLGALRVISRTSVMAYKGARKALPEIAQELNVDAVVEGSVLRAGERVRITAQLIHAGTDSHLWAQSYERDLRDVLTLQSEVARAIAGEIQLKLTAQARARLAGGRKVNPAAYEAYLLGRFHFNKRTEPELKKSIECFERAVQQDPGYALAYSGLADAFTLLGTAGYGGVEPQAAMQKAKAAAQQALALEETLAEAHTSLAFVLFRFDWAWGEAEREFRRALELNPNYATAHQWYALLLSVLGRHAEALAEIEKAQQLDPLSLIVNAARGRLLHFARRYPEAIAQLEKTLGMDPSFARARIDLGMAYLQAGRLGEGIEASQRALELFEGLPSSRAILAYAYAKAGRQPDAEKLLAELQKLSEPPPASLLDYLLAFVYAGLGEKDRAFHCLERAYQQREGLLIYANVEPMFDNLRAESRFQDLLRRMQFPH